MIVFNLGVYMRTENCREERWIPLGFSLKAHLPPSAHSTILTGGLAVLDTVFPGFLAV